MLLSLFGKGVTIGISGMRPGAIWMSERTREMEVGVNREGRLVVTEREAVVGGGIGCYISNEALMPAGFSR